MHLTHIITEAENGWQIQQILMNNLKFSRLLIKRIKQNGSMTLDGVPELMKKIGSAGQIISVTYDDPAGEVFNDLKAPADIPILFQDEWYVICSKPANLVTHPTYLHHENNLTSRLADNRLHPVNRLDRDTSGLVVLAKNGYAHHALTTVEISKEYLALVHGTHMLEYGEINLPIARENGSIMLREINPLGKIAISNYVCEKKWLKAQASLLKYTLKTGRTHQLRLHSLVSGWPIIGETLYGCNRFYYDWPRLRPLFKVEEAKLQPEIAEQIISNSRPGESYMGEFLPPREKIGDRQDILPTYFDRELCLKWDNLMPRQALHAHKISFMHPITGEPLSITADLPNDMKKLLNSLNEFEA